MHNKPLAKVFHFDLYGKRQDKYEFLNNNSVSSVAWKELNYSAPYFFFVPKDFSLIEEYEAGIYLKDLFLKHTSGTETKVDHIATDFEKEKLIKRVSNIITNKLSFEEIRNKYGLSERTTWEYKPDNNLIFKLNKIHLYNYRLFDYRYTYYDDKFLSRSRSEVMRHLLDENIAIVLPRMCKGKNGFQHGFVSKYIVDRAFGDAYSGAGTNIFPLYLYPETSELSAERRPNLNMEIVNKIANDLALRFVNDHELPSEQDTFSPLDLLDYIYAVLHSPNYREKYKEFLKIDFPRVPYPTDIDKFRKLVELGSQLRKIHLLESPLVNNFITEYPIDGSNTVEKIKYVKDKVYINDTQYFDRVPEVAWNFYIGGYQPAQKWLKDRKGRQLQFEDILHYQRIIVALSETAKLMMKVDEVGTKNL